MFCGKIIYSLVHLLGYAYFCSILATFEDPSHKDHLISSDLFTTDQKYKRNFRVGWNFFNKWENIWLPWLSPLTRGKVKFCTKSAKAAINFWVFAKSIPPWNDPTLWPLSCQGWIYRVHNSRSYDFFLQPPIFSNGLIFRKFIFFTFHYKVS